MDKVLAIVAIVCSGVAAIATVVLFVAMVMFLVNGGL